MRALPQNSLHDLVIIDLGIVAQPIKLVLISHNNILQGGLNMVIISIQCLVFRQSETSLMHLDLLLFLILFRQVIDDVQQVSLVVQVVQSRELLHVSVQVHIVC